jgi:cellulose synthase/poly-beta-1,6-N-acetylglucosamine synthase-like glycosyltransferase
MDSKPACGRSRAASFTPLRRTSGRTSAVLDRQDTTAGRRLSAPPEPAPPTPPERGRSRARRWWAPSLVLAAVATVLFVLAATSVLGPGRAAVGSAAWWLLTIALHLPLLVILCFLAAGIVERFGFYFRGRAAAAPGRLPTYPTVCVQLPMFNEHAVARRAIEAASAMAWPADRLSVQVLDDSTDHDTRALVDRVCAEVRASTGVDCRVLRRADRKGYKAGALEAGRRETDAEFVVIFDADFVPPADYLKRTIPHFYRADGQPDTGLALVQTQWGHLNAGESALTRAQSLWVDDHHTLQMSWRAAMWQFVNFTGTAGVWRASAVEAAGGWRATSLVEDCELSFRHLFAGYRTKFVKEIVAPAELPATFTAYKAQQKRWTQGWVQLQRLHLRRLLFEFRCSAVRRLAFAYHMCISWQWPAWALWLTMLPLLIYTDLWFGALGAGVGVALYLLPTVLWLLVATTVASLETKHTYRERLSLATFRRRFARIVPYVVINTGMVAHQFSAFTEGLFGTLHSEFERTPKAASVTGSPRSEGKRRYTVKVHWPYVLAEAFFVAYQLAWTALFLADGLLLAAIGTTYVGACVVFLAYFYGDHAGRVCFVIDRGRADAALASA